jgi:two-component system sensor histidine kinase HupT/HoxJ
LSGVAATAAHWAAKGRVRGAPVTCDLPPDLWVLGHAGQLHQVVVNLVENALDAVAASPAPAPAHAVRVSAGRNPCGTVWVAVEDTGPGVPQDHILKVFDPFFTTKTVGQGTGLGLWISYGIIRDHGGTLAVESLPAAGGARFQFTLPGPDSAPRLRDSGAGTA